MLFASVRKNSLGPQADRVAPSQTVLCVSMICILASTPLLVSVILMIWGG